MESQATGRRPLAKKKNPVLAGKRHWLAELNDAGQNIAAGVCSWTSFSLFRLFWFEHRTDKEEKRNDASSGLESAALRFFFFFLSSSSTHKTLKTDNSIWLATHTCRERRRQSLESRSLCDEKTTSTTTNWCGLNNLSLSFLFGSTTPLSLSLSLTTCPFLLALTTTFGQ